MSSCCSSLYPPHVTLAVPSAPPLRSSVPWGMAILDFCSTVLLNSRLSSRAAAWVSCGLMLSGALFINSAIFTAKADVLMTSYVP